MAAFISIGIISLLVGVLFILSPDTLRRINDWSMTMVSAFDRKAFKYRTGLGLTLIIASILFFFVAYYISVRG